MIAFLTPAGEIENANRHVLEYLGTTLEELKGGGQARRSIRTIFRLCSRPRSERLPRDAAPYDIDHRIRRADGVYRWFHGRVMPLRMPEVVSSAGT